MKYMETTCNLPLEDLPFTLFGLCLQEPMSLVTNLLIAIPAFVFFLRLRKEDDAFKKNWAFFFLFLSISTGLGGLSHVFFQYTGMVGKMVTWFFSFISVFYSGRAMLSVPILPPKIRKVGMSLLVVRILIFAVLAFATIDFLFITIDTAIGYLAYCLGLGIYYWRKGLNSFKYMVYGIIVLVPSIFIFLLKINPHIWFNKNDLSHVIIAITITFFYISVRNYKLEKNS